MKAFVVKFEQLFKMDTGRQGELANFSVNKRELLIPLYQREYTWTDEKIVTLVNDIKRCNKYLGNVILDEVETCYEIVDGQQRITTCFLILVCLYNKYAGRQREQDTIMRLLKPYGEFVLKNDSIGNYIREANGVLSLGIETDNDVYYQKDEFERAFETITREIDKLQEHENILEFRRKLLDCEILILINDQHDNIHPVEQLFLDINEKAQLLQVEDIFKGHCFENFEECFHRELRELWIELKKCAMGFKRFGYKDASEYIYLYLLENEGNLMPKNLTVCGKHYLDGKNMDATEDILVEMVTYGKNNLFFYDNLLNTDYRFVDLCSNSQDYRNTGDHLVLKHMCKSMLESTAAQYQKLPLLYFIYSLRRNEGMVDIITHKQFRKIITNLYIYAMLFIMGGAKKSKKDIDYSIRDAINRGNGIGELVISAKELRCQRVEEFSMQDNFGSNKMMFIYSVIDAYDSNQNWINTIYSHETGYTLEHFIIPDNRNRMINWKDGDNSFEFELPVNDVRLYKKKVMNYLIIDKELNESLEHDDIVSKIRDIRLWYESRDADLPNHVSMIIEKIEQMSQYSDLKNMKEGNYPRETIKSKYIEFVRSYFQPENGLLETIQVKFINSFQNN